MRPSDPIGVLRRRLRELETERRFDDWEYPRGLSPFPWPLSGRGFFPGGDGLWRDPDAESIAGPARQPFPFDGLMFVGQDFGTLKQYPSRDKAYEQNNVPSWLWLVRRIEKSGVPGQRAFFTNALLGLRESGSTVGQNHATSDPRYASMCREFLAYQIEVLDPRLVVMFQTVDASIYSPLFENDRALVPYGRVRSATIVGRQRIWMTSKHPRSDSGVFNSNPTEYALRCADLASAWHEATKEPPSF